MRQCFFVTVPPPEIVAVVDGVVGDESTRGEAQYAEMGSRPAAVMLAQMARRKEPPFNWRCI